MDQEILKKIQDAAFQIYEERAMELLKRDCEYQRLSVQEQECEQKYQQIQEILPKEDVETLTKMLSFRDREAILLNFWTFIVGMEVGASFADLLNEIRDKDKIMGAADAAPVWVEGNHG